MNAVEIEQAISDLAERPFDLVEFPFAFLEAFGNRDTTLKKLRSAASNKSDLGGVLQANHIHIKVASQGTVAETLTALRDSPATQNKRHKVRFILATDGIEFEAEDLTTGETVACTYTDFPDHFGFFLPLAGITTVKQIRENAFDVRATSRLNRLYITLLAENPEWGTAERRHDMNHFMARLIFCFFAEDTDIFTGDGLFTATIAQMSDRDSSNTHTVISEIFRAMNTAIPKRTTANLPRWADVFPYVNGGLFSGSTEVPRFSKIAQKYLLHIGHLDWKKINPDIFGSMIQAVADEGERSDLGMHYTSVPNILKVLNPLFLDDLRSAMDEAGDNPRKLLNLRKRMSNIRVFDPACGSGNFLVIAYKEMRAIEAAINARRGEGDRETDIPLTNFRGIELRDFSCEIARLALIIAEFQCDVIYRGPKVAREQFLPLDSENWITCDNALRADWLSVCPPTGATVKYRSNDLFGSLLVQPEIDFENAGGETYICGNPQFKGARKQSKAQKEDLSELFLGHNDYKDCDYVAGWLLKAADYISRSEGSFAFVSTSSISQGEQVAHIWKRLYRLGCHISFAHTGFKWHNNASNNAVVHCVIVGVTKAKRDVCFLFDEDLVREVSSISPYLFPGKERYVISLDRPVSESLSSMVSGSMPRDDGNLILCYEEAKDIRLAYPDSTDLIKGFVGSQELVHFRDRFCLWINDVNVNVAKKIQPIAERIERVREFRQSSSAKTTQGYASIPHKFAQRAHRDTVSLVVAKTSSEKRHYLPADFMDERVVVSDAAFACYDAQLWQFAMVVSSLHRAWIGTICGKLETRFRYSSTLGWNTFPVPKLTERNKADLTACAEDILLTREAHFPATIADLYDPETMPEDLRAAHDRNDETLERIYIGRRFKNDTERLEKLFDMYTQMTTKVPQQ